MRRSAKVDNNSTKIIEALRQIGAVVIPTHQLKNAFDAVVCYRGKTFIVEIKNPERLPKVYDRERLVKSLSDGERECMNRIESTGNAYHIVCSVDEALNLVNGKGQFVG